MEIVMYVSDQDHNNSCTFQPAKPARVRVCLGALTEGDANAR